MKNKKKLFFSRKIKNNDADKTITRIIKKDNTSEILISMPKGWAGTVTAGIFVSLCTWIIPIIFTLLAYFASTDNPALNETTWYDAIIIGTDFWSLILGIPIKFNFGNFTLIPLTYTFFIIMILYLVGVRVKFDNSKASLGLILGFVITSASLILILPSGVSLFSIIISTVVISSIAVLFVLVKKEIFSFGFQKYDDSGNDKNTYFNLFLYQFSCKKLFWLENANYLVKRNIQVICAFSIIVFLACSIYSIVDFIKITRSLHTDPIGFAFLLLIQIGYIPTIMIWNFVYYSGGYIYMGNYDALFSTGNNPQILLPNIPIFSIIKPVNIGNVSYFLLPILSIITIIILYYRNKNFKERTAIEIAKMQCYQFVFLLVVFTISSYITTGSISKTNLAIFGPKIFISALFIDLQIILAQLLILLILRLIYVKSIFTRTKNYFKNLKKSKDKISEISENSNAENKNEIVTLTDQENECSDNQENISNIDNQNATKEILIDNSANELNSETDIDVSVSNSENSNAENKIDNKTSHKSNVKINDESNIDYESCAENELADNSNIVTELQDDVTSDLESEIDENDKNRE